MGNSRLRWQCRCGMRELDVLLSGWLEDGYEASGEPAKAAFQRLLELPDPELQRYFLGGVKPADEEIADVVDTIRGRNRGR